MSLSPYLDICKFVFNFSNENVYQNVDFTNIYYGSVNPQGSRILFVNGKFEDRGSVYKYHLFEVLKPGALEWEDSG